MSRPDVIKVILADDHLVVRAGLKALLSTSKDIEVVGEASNGRDAVALVDRLSPHVAVLDLDMPQMDGLTATKEIVGKNSGTRVLILTMHTEDEFLVNLLEAGAAGYLVKNAADRELADAVRAVAAGDNYVQASAARALARQVSKRGEHADERAQYQQLTERERDVLVHVAGGLLGVGDRRAAVHQPEDGRDVQAAHHRRSSGSRTARTTCSSAFASGC
jgi:DNA-binding NarL/FixJ family response regulator